MTDLKIIGLPRPGSGVAPARGAEDRSAGKAVHGAEEPGRAAHQRGAGAASGLPETGGCIEGRWGI